MLTDLQICCFYATELKEVVMGSGNNKYIQNFD
jgi:hypothetical protein